MLHLTLAGSTSVLFIRNKRFASTHDAAVWQTWPCVFPSALISQHNWRDNCDWIVLTRLVARTIQHWTHDPIKRTLFLKRKYRCLLFTSKGEVKRQGRVHWRYRIIYFVTLRDTLQNIHERINITDKLIVNEWIVNSLICNVIINSGTR